MQIGEHLIKTEKIDGPFSLVCLLNKLLKNEDTLDQDKEHAWSIGFYSKNNIAFIDLVSIGTINKSFMHPREIFRRAIVHSCTSIVIAHNHPHGGKAMPSDADINLAKRLASAGQLLKIPVIDFIIVGARGDEDYNFNYFSFLEKCPATLRVGN